jgi:MYXO-CTERM domain-containing protein
MKIQTIFLALALLPGACFADIVVNGGFETGDFTGWTVVDASSNTFVAPIDPHSGVYDAVLGAYPTDGSLSQFLATTPGQNYTLTYWLGNEGGIPNDFGASWDGLTISGSVITDNLNGFDYTQFSFANLPAVSSTTLLQFTFSQTPAYWHLDDVSVDPTPTPEPGVPRWAASIAALGLVVFGAWRRRPGALKAASR